MKKNKELNQQIRNVAVDKNGRPTIDVDERKSIYKSISEALKAIPITNRNVGLTISIYNGSKVIEYWWEKGIKDSDLIKKINTDDIPRIDAKLVDLQNQIDGINNIEFKVFDSLPELGDSSIIYVIPNTVSEKDDDFIEYFWIKSQQRYERFGGLNVDGGVTINNLYSFDSNIFTVDEESNIKNVSLNSKKIVIGDKSIEIYKYDIGREDNEKRISINTYSNIIRNTHSEGGIIKLNGSFTIYGSTPKILECQLQQNGLTATCTQGETINSVSLVPQNLTIEQDINKSIITFNGIYLIENENNTFEASKTQLYTNTGEIKLYSSTGFDINYSNDYGIKGFSDNDIKQVLLYALDNNIVITNDNIELNIANASYIHLNNNIFNATFNQLIYLNAPTTKVKKVLFEENSGSDIYLEPYNETAYNVNYRGLRSESNIYIKDSNSYFVKSQSNYSLTSYGLNGIKHRDSSTSTNLGYNILNIGDRGVLTLGRASELTINDNAILLQQDTAQLGAFLLIDKIYNEISLQKGYNINKFIKIDKDNNIVLKNGISEINIFSDNEIELKGNNSSYFNIDSDGWCIIKGYASSKIGLVGTNNVQSYFVIEEGDHTLPDMKMQQNSDNYIYLYKNNESENHINIKSEYFKYIGDSNNETFSIDSDNDVLFQPGNKFVISSGDNYYKFIVDIVDGIDIGKSNKININNSNMQFTLGSKTITIDSNGISDGTNTKTWAQLLS